MDKVRQYFHVSIPVESSLETCLFVWGSAGTGKTLILVEALKMKMSKLLHMGKTARIFGFIPVVFRLR